MSAETYTQIGWVGLGQMGLPMVTRLLDGGIEVGVYNRSPDKTAPISAKGAKVYGSTAELVRACPVIFLMVSDYAAVCDILNGVRDGLAWQNHRQHEHHLPDRKPRRQSTCRSRRRTVCRSTRFRIGLTRHQRHTADSVRRQRSRFKPAAKNIFPCRQKNLPFRRCRQRLGRETRLELALRHFRRSVQRSDADGAAVRHRYRHHRRSHRRLGNGLAYVSNKKITMGKP